MEDYAFKEALFEYCFAKVDERIQQAEKAMKAAQDAANNEEKSSMGDKYETGRAMSHNERDMSARQLSEANSDKLRLLQINKPKVYKSVESGSVVMCENICFFISIGLGQTIINAVESYILSAAAPLAKQLSGKKVGDTILFKNQKHTIQRIF